MKNHNRASIYNFNDKLILSRGELEQRSINYSKLWQQSENVEKYYKSLQFIKQLQKQPDFIDNYTKFSKQNVIREELQNIVQQVTEQIIESINKKVHETFYREINLLVTQVLSIRQEMTIFSRDQFRYREQLKSQVTIIGIQLKEQMKKVNKIVEYIRKENRNMTIPSFSRHLSSKLQEKQYQKSSISKPSYLENIEMKKEILMLSQKLEEFKQQTSKQQYKLSSRLDQTKQKHLNVFNSLRKEIDQISESMTIQTIIQKDIKQLFQSMQKIKECLFQYQKEVTQLKEDLGRYEDSGIFYLSNSQRF